MPVSMKAAKRKKSTNPLSGSSLDEITILGTLLRALWLGIYELHSEPS